MPQFVANDRLAALLDLDGTLFDSLGIWDQIDIEFLADRGIALPADYARTIEHMSLITAAQYTIDRFHLHEQPSDLVQEWQYRAMQAYRHVQYKPHVLEFLQTLRECEFGVALVSSLSRPLFEQADLATHVSSYADAVCLTDDIGSCGKDKPDVFVYAAKQLQCAYSHCIVFDDTVEAIRTANSLGMYTCAVLDPRTRTSWQDLQTLAQYAITDFAQAPSLLKHCSSMTQI